MAKTIKFNLVLDNNKARTLDDVREHFSIEDILKQYENGLLLRWLKVRGYAEQYEAVEKIDRSQDLLAIIKQLIKIFDVEIDDAEIEKGIYIMKYCREDEERKEKYKENTFEFNLIINDYFNGYHALISHMLDNKDNMAVLKADALEMVKYNILFEKDFYRLYFFLYENAPKAIFAMLTVDEIRKHWLGEMKASKNTEEYDFIAREPQKVVYYHIKQNFLSFLSIRKLKEVLGDDLKTVTRDTNGMWDALEPSNVKVMVIETEEQINVKNAGEFLEKLEHKDVQYKLPILNGLEFQCSSSNQSLLYMEV